MSVRQATVRDVAQIKDMFQEIIHDMDARGIRIWNDYYPCEVFPDDVAARRLYVLEDQGEIVAAFALCEEPDNIDCLAWQDRHAPARYLYRFGVRTRCARQGVGGQALQAAEKFAKDLGAHYLRLLVVDANEPAIRFYQKHGYQQAAGLRDEPLGDTVLKEYGFEKNLLSTPQITKIDSYST